MNKKIIALILATYITGIGGTVYASEGTTTNTNQATNETVTQTVTIEENEIKDSAGILPDSPFYRLELAIEKLQVAITKSEEKLATLKAQLATERAAEAAVMGSEGQEELASEATCDYMKMLASATEHLNKAIETKDKAEQTLVTLNEAYKKSEEILKTMIENASDESKLAIENALNEQDKAIKAINVFHATKVAFHDAKDQLEEAKKQLEEVKKRAMQRQSLQLKKR
jgi:hypothetical protein